ncbi:MAG: serine protease [Planctomycetota bacterium]|nr:MAG: serine protease [Planctomycetota bacterium]
MMNPVANYPDKDLVVKIRYSGSSPGAKCKKESEGTAFFVKPNLLATCRHVIQPDWESGKGPAAKEYKGKSHIKFPEKEKWTVKKVHWDVQNQIDFALLEINEEVKLNRNPRIYSESEIQKETGWSSRVYFRDCFESMKLDGTVLEWKASDGEICDVREKDGFEGKAGASGAPIQTEYGIFGLLAIENGRSTMRAYAVPFFNVLKDSKLASLLDWPPEDEYQRDVSEKYKEVLKRIQSQLPEELQISELKVDSTFEGLIDGFTYLAERYDSNSTLLGLLMEALGWLTVSRRELISTHIAKANGVHKLDVNSLVALEAKVAFEHKRMGSFDFRGRKALGKSAIHSDSRVGFDPEGTQKGLDIEREVKRYTGATYSALDQPEEELGKAIVDLKGRNRRYWNQYDLMMRSKRPLPYLPIFGESGSDNEQLNSLARKLYDHFQGHLQVVRFDLPEKKDTSLHIQIQNCLENILKIVANAENPESSR